MRWGQLQGAIQPSPLSANWTGSQVRSLPAVPRGCGSSLPGGSAVAQPTGLQDQATGTPTSLPFLVRAPGPPDTPTPPQQLAPALPWSGAVGRPSWWSCRATTGPQGQGGPLPAWRATFHSHRRDSLCLSKETQGPRCGTSIPRAQFGSGSEWVLSGLFRGNH